MGLENDILLHDILVQISFSGCSYHTLRKGSSWTSILNKNPAAMSENEKAIFCTTSSKKNMCSDMEKHPFFLSAKHLDRKMCEKWKPSMPPKSYKSNWTIWTHWGVEDTAREHWHNSSGLWQLLGRVYFLVSCSLIKILCNTWDSPRTLMNYLFGVGS